MDYVVMRENKNIITDFLSSFCSSGYSSFLQSPVGGYFSPRGTAQWRGLKCIALETAINKRSSFHKPFAGPD